MDMKILGQEEGARITVTPISDEGGISYYQVRAEYDSERIPQPFTVRFRHPSVEVYSVWSHSIRFDRHLGANWSKRTTNSRLAAGFPLQSLVSAQGKNRLAVAVSDCKTPMSLGCGVCEEDANIEWDIRFFTVQVAPLKAYEAIIRLDSRDVSYCDAIYDAVEWWERDCGYESAYVPDHARLPMNSLWYSYHQRLDVEDIIKECELSKPLGMDTVIIDDGWQTDDNARGYKFCGDWEVAPGKIPDMRAFVERLHQIPMKVMLWYSVPFMGVGCKQFEHFRDMLLDGTGDKKTFFSLDPRYKEVREYLIGIYTRALTEWDLDGLKLDFIDAFRLEGKSLEYDPRRDFNSLEDAIDTLMVDVAKALREINPQVLIEFRQPYVGPAIRKYGNMLRVGDCPNCALCNRQDSMSLRLTAGKTAIHSDMLLWHTQDTVESAALQFASVLFTVPQVSVKIAKLPEEHKQMLKYYLAFWRQHRQILLDGRLEVTHPESATAQVRAKREGKAVVVAYTDRIVTCRGLEGCVAVNCSGGDSLILRGAIGKSYRVVDCMGREVQSGAVESGLYEVSVPLAGMVYIGQT